MLIFLAFLALYYLGIKTNFGSEQLDYYTYECDGEILYDKCAFSKLTNGGVLIKDCKSGNEYFCQSAKELHEWNQNKRLKNVKK